MQLRRAIATGLRRSFDFRGHSRRAEYLPFLGFAIILEAALLGLGAALLPTTAFATYAMATLILLYIPVTSAGMRRLRDAGQPPELMLNPLKPVAVALLALGALVMLINTPLGFAAFYLSALVASPLIVALCALGAIGVSLTTALYFSDTASRLLLPSELGRPSMSKVQP